jgi:hypothetical protein
MMVTMPFPLVQTWLKREELSFSPPVLYFFFLKKQNKTKQNKETAI